MSSSKDLFLLPGVDRKEKLKKQKQTNQNRKERMYTLKIFY